MRQRSIKHILNLLIFTLALYASFSHQNLFAQNSVKHGLEQSFYDPAILSSQFTSWGMSADPKYVQENASVASINIDDAWKIFRKKRDVVVAVIDTGIDHTHPYIALNLYSKNGQITQNNFGVDFSKRNKITQTPSDEHGHGTHISGIIKSIFPNVKILPLKYYNPDASGQENLNSTINALKYAVDLNVDIINYSGGGPEASNEELQILKVAARKGILIIAAAGNEKSNIDKKINAYYPASYGLDNIITVTAHDRNLSLLSVANWGRNSVDISAPGHHIRSSIPNGRAGYMTGTSQATAFVTGVASLLMAHYPEFKYQEIKDIIVSSAVKNAEFIDKCISGGKLDASEAFKFAEKYKHTQESKTRKLANEDNKPDMLIVKSTEQVPGTGKIIYRKIQKN